ncbi:hypothetical protein [Streptomyces boninensis]|uniref:hypothetical protein n=1 Tax=Streptomyces boninensis TaxID=2039455 RepID=UPI003B213E04
MARRAAAALVLLFACLFAPATLGHLGAIPSFAAEAAPGAESMPAPKPAPAAAALTGTAARTASSGTGPDAAAPPPAAPLTVEPRKPRPRPDLSRTAREASRPTAGATPTPATLQTFRH